MDFAESLSAPLFLKNSNADGLSLAAIVDCASSISLTDMAASLRAVSSSIPLLSSSGCRAVVVGGVGWGGWGDAPATATVPPAAAAAASAAFLSLSSMNLLLGLPANGPLVRCLASGNASPGPGAVGAVGGIGAPVLLLSITSPTTSRISAVGSKPWAGPVPNESSSACDVGVAEGSTAALAASARRISSGSTPARFSGDGSLGGAPPTRVTLAAAFAL